MNACLTHKMLLKQSKKCIKFHYIKNNVFEQQLHSDKIMGVEFQF